MKLTILGASGRTGTHLTEQALAAGHDVVACPKITGGPQDLPLASGTATILAAMRTQDVRRLVYSWGPSILVPRKPLLRAVRSASFALLGLLPATRSMVNETVQVGEAIRGSDRDWTLVVVTAPNDQPGSGTVKVRTATGTGDRVGSRISRADLAQFMLAQADDLRYAQQELRISN